MAGKRKPTYDLDAFKSTFSTVEKLDVTGTALRTADAITEFLLLSFKEKDNE